MVGCAVYQPDEKVIFQSQDAPEVNFAKAEELEKAMAQLLEMGVPGVALSVASPSGNWSKALGFTKIEGRIPMQTCHLHYLQSIAKTYMAVAILKLREMGKLDLDKTIDQYLSPEYLQYLKATDKITVRMLLNHTSGLPEYNSHPINISKLLQEPERLIPTREYFKSIRKSKMRFEPGARFLYTNLNYEILALIGDQLTGDHAQFISQIIFKPLELNETYYRYEANYLKYEALNNAYWDRHSDGIIENVSLMQRINVASMIGDDGIVSTPRDAVLFLKGLMEGKVIDQESLRLMKEWVKDKNGLSAYGLGLDIARFAEKEAYGHSGGGLGAGCQLYYFPHNQTYFFLGINLGTITDSPIHQKALPVLAKIHQILADLE
ncbi:MAG: serine hydrolase domain-containing protein, partial [Bacteroidota bacterium]